MSSSRADGVSQKTDKIAKDSSGKEKFAQKLKTKGNEGADKEATGSKTSEPASSSSKLDTKPKGRRGPDGALMLPIVLPKEAMHIMGSLPMSLVSIDGTPDRSITLTDNRWRIKTHEWIDKHKKALSSKDVYWTDSNFESPEAAAKAARGKNIVDYAIKAAVDESLEQDSDWVSLCRPYWDKEAEFGEMEGEEDEEDEGDEEDEDNQEDDSYSDQDEDGGGDEEAEGDTGNINPDSCASSKPCKRNKGCVEGDLADNHPGWPWAFTRKGLDRYSYWVQESMKRDQDSFNMHIYNDWSGYGIMEVLENMVCSPVLRGPLHSYRQC